MEFTKEQIKFINDVFARLQVSVIDPQASDLVNKVKEILQIVNGSDNFNETKTEEESQ